MGRVKQKGKAGAAKAYITRSSAVKKLQCSLADFRRLCILKGIFPREPRHRKRANKGSSAPTSFYYTKDIAYLAHEPVLGKLREHKAFAKKLSRALGRGEWSSAKSLEDNKPVYTLDHIIKERYPTFIDAIRDIDDALCMIFLFASLPSESRIQPTLIENCFRLASEWQLYVMHTRALRKAFLSIKGIYYQVEVMDQTVTWLVPYQFTQSIPPDVDARVMLTFLELYQTLLGFVFFKLFTDAGLVYPPALDLSKDETGAGLGAFSLQSAQPITSNDGNTSSQAEGDAKRVSTKAVKQSIKSIAAGGEAAAEEADMVVDDAPSTVVEEDFVVQASKSGVSDSAALLTLQTISSLPSSTNTDLFAPYTFWLSRETPRPIFEFLVRSFGGRIGWPATSGSGSPFNEDDASITHVIIDRPSVPRSDESEELRERRRLRKHVQPQWVVDCINAGKILLEEPYEQGKMLPPHLSPFSTYEGAYDPTAAADAAGEEMSDVEEEEDEEETAQEGKEAAPAPTPAFVAALTEAEEPAALRAAELEAEAAGVDFDDFEKELSKTRKKSKGKDAASTARDQANSEANMNKIMMSNKQRKLYERMKYGENKRAAERETLEAKKRSIDKEKKRKERKGMST